MIGDIAAFDTDIADVITFTDIANVLVVMPGVPDNGASGRGFDRNRSVLTLDTLLRRNVEVNAVGHGADGELALLRFTRQIIGFVDEARAFKTADDGLRHVRHGKIGVEGKSQRGRGLTAILDLPLIYINGGRRGFLVGITPQALVQALSPQLVEVALK